MQNCWNCFMTLTLLQIVQFTSCKDQSVYRWSLFMCCILVKVISQEHTRKWWNPFFGRNTAASSLDRTTCSCITAKNRFQHFRVWPWLMTLNKMILSCPSVVPLHVSGWTVKVQTKDVKMLKWFFRRNFAAYGSVYFRYRPQYSNFGVVYVYCLALQIFLFCIVLYIICCIWIGIRKDH